MNLLADESVDAAIVHRLRAEGYAVESVAEMSPSLPDDDVLAQATGSGRVLLTADKDFGELVYRLGRAHAGVVLLRFAGLPTADRADITADAFRVRGGEFPDAFTVIEPTSIRVRRPNPP